MILAQIFSLMKHIPVIIAFVCLLLPSCAKTSQTDIKNDDLDAVNISFELFSMDDVLDDLQVIVMNQESYDSLTIKFHPQNHLDYDVAALGVYIPVIDASNKEYSDFLTSIIRNAESNGIFNAVTAYSRKHGMPYLLYGGISSEVIVRSDKVLFGEKPGTNLARYFDACKFSNHSHYFFSYPDYDCLAFYTYPSRVPFPELYTVGVALLQTPFCLSLNRIPSEQYDEFSLTIELPVVTESWMRFDSTYDSLGDPSIPLMTTEDNRLLKGTITIHIGQTL